MEYKTKTRNLVPVNNSDLKVATKCIVEPLDLCIMDTVTLDLCIYHGLIPVQRYSTSIIRNNLCDPGGRVLYREVPLWSTTYLY